MQYLTPARPPALEGRHDKVPSPRSGPLDNRRVQFINGQAVICCRQRIRYRGQHLLRLRRCKTYAGRETRRR
jgi:hypothetical protein